MNYLLVIEDAQFFEKSGAASALQQLRTTSRKTLNVILFADSGTERIASCLNKWLPDDRITILDTSCFYGKTASSVRKNIAQFISQLGSGVVETSRKKIGKAWAGKMAELWWYSFLSEKNSPGEQVWWIIFYLAVTERVLLDIPCSHCFFVGSSRLKKLLEQLCRKNGVAFYLLHQNFDNNSIVKLLIMRALGLLSSMFIIATAKLSGAAFSARQVCQQKKRIFIFSYFPRVWTRRFGKWQDAYWGDSFDELSLKNKGVVYVLFLLDRDNISYFKNVVDRIKKLKFSATRPKQYILLESFGRFRDIARFYLNFTDLIRFLKISRSKEYRALFQYDGICLAPLFEYPMIKSAIVWWPAMLLLKSSVGNLGRKLTPDLVLMPFFEYIDGRAIVKGIKHSCNCPVFGFQHGPITEMKINYSGQPKELEPDYNMGNPLPFPDKILIDGSLAKEILRERGIPAYDLVMNGPPRYDTLWERARLASEQERFKTSPVVIIASLGLHDAEIMAERIFQALGKMKDIRIIVRLHPKYVLDRIDKMISSYRVLGGAEIVISKQGSIYDCMEEGDMLITSYSAAGIEAIAFGLTVVGLKLNHSPDMSPLAYKGSPLLTASTARELRCHVVNITKDDEFRQDYKDRLHTIVNHNFYKTASETAAIRIATYCLNYME